MISHETLYKIYLPACLPACLMLCLALLLPQAAHAECKINGVTNTRDYAAAKINFGRINLHNPLLYQGNTLLDSIVIPPTNYTYNGANANSVLWTCDKQDIVNGDVHFLVSTNGDERYGGLHEIGGKGSGIYATWIEHIGLLQSMDGMVLTEYWQELPLPRHLTQADGDVVHIRLSDIPPLVVELYWTDALVPDEGQTYCVGPARLSDEWVRSDKGALYTCMQPASYIQLVGPGIEHDEPNRHHQAPDIRAWFANNGFAYTLTGALKVSTIPGCVIESADQSVRFETARVEQMQSNGEIHADFNIMLSCSDGTISGTHEGAVAIGLQVSPGAYSAAEQLGFVDKNNNSVAYLLSDQYGQPGIAKGVGIELYEGSWSGTRRFVGQPGRVGIGHPGGREAGWYSIMWGVKDGDVVPLPSGDYRVPLQFTAKLRRLPEPAGETVTPGKVSATATVLVKVQ